MRSLLAVIVLLAAMFVGSALAEDPPGGKGWYQAVAGFNVSTAQGMLIISADTPGFLVGTTTVAGALKLNVRFERGIATWLNQEITSDGQFRETLTIRVDPSEVRALLRQPLSKAPPPPGDSSTPPAPTGGGGARTLGPMDGVIGGGVGTPSVNVHRETTVVVDDNVTVVRRAATAGAPGSEGPRPGVQVFPPSSSRSPDGGAGKATRAIAREEHDAWLLKVLRLWDEEAARCETKGYGPGWVSICESAA